MIYVFLANGFEETEAIAPIDILRRAEKEVITVGVGGELIHGAHGISVVADIVDKEFILSDDIEMIVLPGGMPGTLNLEKSPVVQGAVRFCVTNNKYIGAICAAPSILGHRGFINGKNVTCFPGYENELGTATRTGDEVTADGNIITARGAGVSVEFGLKLVEILCGKGRADALYRGMQCR